MLALAPPNDVAIRTKTKPGENTSNGGERCAFFFTLLRGEAGSRKAAWLASDGQTFRAPRTAEFFFHLSRLFPRPLGVYKYQSSHVTFCCSIRTRLIVSKFFERWERGKGSHDSKDGFMRPIFSASMAMALKTPAYCFFVSLGCSSLFCSRLSNFPSFLQDGGHYRYFLHEGFVDHVSRCTIANEQEWVELLWFKGALPAT